jgi:DDE superfamily endonuclease
MDHCMPGMIGTCTKSGGIDEKTFNEWFQHFLLVVQPKERREPVLLILDGHASHTRNFDVIEEARLNNVILLCIPSHTSHRLQPLDVSFFRSLKAKYNEEVRIWLRSHPGRKLCEDQIAQHSSHAYGDTACPRNAMNGFCKSGWYFENKSDKLRPTSTEKLSFTVSVTFRISSDIVKHFSSVLFNLLSLRYAVFCSQLFKFLMCTSY